MFRFGAVRVMLDRFARERQFVASGANVETFGAFQLFYPLAGAVGPGNQPDDLARFGGFHCSRQSRRHSWARPVSRLFSVPPAEQWGWRFFV